MQNNNYNNVIYKFIFSWHWVWNRRIKQLLKRNPNRLFVWRSVNNGTCTFCVKCRFVTQLNSDRLVSKLRNLFATFFFFFFFFCFGFSISIILICFCLVWVYVKQLTLLVILLVLMLRVVVEHYVCRICLLYWGLFWLFWLCSFCFYWNCFIFF